jgi:hypothetical protein
MCEFRLVGEANPPRRAQTSAPPVAALAALSCIGLVRAVTVLVILIVDEDCILAFKFEGQTPISADTDRPMILELSHKPMKFPSRSIHVAWSPCIIEREQLQSQLAGVLRLNPGFRPGASCRNTSPACTQQFTDFRCNNRLLQSPSCEEFCTRLPQFWR